MTERLLKDGPPSEMTCRKGTLVLIQQVYHIVQELNK